MQNKCYASFCYFLKLMQYCVIHVNVVTITIIINICVNTEIIIRIDIPRAVHQTKSLVTCIPGLDFLSSYSTAAFWHVSTCSISLPGIFWSRTLDPLQDLTTYILWDLPEIQLKKAYKQLLLYFKQKMSWKASKDYPNSRINTTYKSNKKENG